MVRIAINGFGRIGRCTFRHALRDPGVEVVQVNGTADPATLAHLLKYDSTYGRYPGTVEAGEGKLTVDGKDVPVASERDLARLDWKGVDVVLECTGEYTDRAQAEKHLAAGARKVIIAAPAKGEDITLVLGVNESRYDTRKHAIISAASCTTNCLAPVVKVLEESFGIESGLMTTIHAYTMDQRLLDGTHRDLRRARAATASLIPTTTGAAKALNAVIPSMEGRLNGFAVRVPTATVSLVDLTVHLKKPASPEEINASFRSAAEGPLKGILGYTEEPLVSADFRGDERSAVVDGLSTLAAGRLAKVLAWYDNEWAYAKRLVDLAKLVGT